MEIEVTLFSFLDEYAPQGETANPFKIFLGNRVTVGGLTVKLNFPPGIETVATVNNRYVRDDHELRDGDKVNIFPAILAGG